VEEMMLENEKKVEVGREREGKGEDGKEEKS